MADPAIKIIPTPYEDVLTLLHSESLRNVEQAIAGKLRMRIVEDYSNVCTNYTRSDISVSGMTVGEVDALLTSRRDEIVAFGIRLLKDQEATSEEEFPEDEEQDQSEKKEVHGLGTGFGVKYAIFFNFLANRTSAEFRAYLKNRRIPNQAKFAKALRSVYEETRQ